MTQHQSRQLLQQDPSKRVLGKLHRKQRTAACPGKTLEVLPDRERVSLGALEFNYLAERGWINIETEDGLRARVLLAGQSVESKDVKVLRYESGTFECPEIDLKVSWNNDGDAVLQHNDQIRIAKKS